MPSIRSGEITGTEGPDVRRVEHFLKLLDIVDNAFNVHPEQYSEPALQPGRTNEGSLHRITNLSKDIFILGQLPRKNSCDRSAKA